MKRDWLVFYVFMSKVMAVLTIASAVIIVISYGKLEIPSVGRYSQPQEIINWPVIAGSTASAIYACLFAAMFSAVRYACYFAQDAAASKTNQPAAPSMDRDWVIEAVCADGIECRKVLDRVAYIGEMIGERTAIIGPFADIDAAGRALLEIERLTGVAGKLAPLERPHQ